MKAPYPYFGGKARVAGLIWSRFGDVSNYVEPFFGSGAVLLARPHQPQTETVNDADGFIANLWRAIRHDPDAVASWADWPVNEADLHARHKWLVARGPALVEWLEADPDNYDAKIAGWWLWGICQWIGSGWCSGAADASGGQGVEGDAGRGIHRKLPHLGDAGMGVHRQLPHLGNAGMGVHRKRPHLGNAGMGVHRKRPHLGDAGREGDAQDALNAHREYLTATMRQLQARLRRVRVCCGDWSRVLGPSPTVKLGMTAVFLDPPYAQSERDSTLYAVETEVSAAVREWAIANGDNPLLRICLAGYAGEHEMPATWEAVSWKAHGGYGSQGEGRGRENARREMLWFSPGCLKPTQDLFGWAQEHGGNHGMPLAL